MKKFITSIVATVTALSMTASATVMEFKINDTQLNVLADDGNIIGLTLEAAPYTVNDRTVVPVRVISETFGAQVDWDEATETVTVTKGDRVIKLTIGKTVATVNGEEIPLDVAPFTANDRTLLPVRFVSEVLGYQVDYEGMLDTVLITDEAVAMTINGREVPRAAYKMLYDEVAASGYYTDANQITTLIENLLTEMYVFSEGNVMSEFASAYLNENLSFDGYIAEIGIQALETTYTQLMIKNAMALDAYSGIATKIDPVDDSAVEKMYSETYVTAKHILISTDDNETGEPLSDAEIKKAEKLAKDIKKRIDKGEDFDKLMNEYSQDPGSAYYPNGYTFTYNEMVSEFEEASFALEVGKVSAPVLSTYGYHIIKRMPLEPVTEQLAQSIKAAEEQALVQVYAASLVDSAEVIKNQEVINSIIGK